MEISELSLERVEGVFPHLENTYFFTIKPPREIPVWVKVEKMTVLKNYLLKRNLPHLIVLCISENGFEHYHGLVTISMNGPRVLSSLKRYANRNYGYIKIEPVVRSIISAYEYIMNIPRNNPQLYHLNNI